jgi:hypothetical protein
VGSSDATAAAAAAAGGGGSAAPHAAGVAAGGLFSLREAAGQLAARAERSLEVGGEVRAGVQSSGCIPRCCHIGCSLHEVNTCACQCTAVLAAWLRSRTATVYTGSWHSHCAA